MNIRQSFRIALLLFALAGAESTGAVIVVDDDGPPAHFDTIQNAIANVHTTHGDVILVRPGVYVENIHFMGKNIVLTSEHPSNRSLVAQTIIDGQANGPVVLFAGSEDPNCLLTGFTILNGLANMGGGIRGNHTQAAIENCIIRHNQSISNGGGLAQCQGAIVNCIVSSNVAESGGGFAECHGQIINCLVFDNRATAVGMGRGGGLQACSGQIANCTIVENSADDVGAGLSDCLGVLTNIIVWDNEAGTVLADERQISASSVPSYSCIQDWTAGGMGNITDDPQFADPDGFDNDVSTVTVEDNSFRLLRPSPCIDAGDNLALLPTVTTDADGAPRYINRYESDDPYADPGNGVPPIVDMGAYEWGLQEDIIRVTSQRQFDNRTQIRVVDPHDPSALGRIRRLVPMPGIPEGAVIDMNTHAPGYPPAGSVAVRAKFYPTTDDTITVTFKWCFVQTSAATRLNVYLSDSEQVGNNLSPVAYILPPNPTTPGGTAGNQFALFRGTFNRGLLNFNNGVYVELELRGSEVWIDDWGVENQCTGFCGDYSADDVSTFMDFLFLNARYGMANYAATQNCLFLGDDGYMGLADVLVWDEDNLVCKSGAAASTSAASDTMAPFSLAQSTVDAAPLLVAARSSNAGIAQDILYTADTEGICLSPSQTALCPDIDQCPALNGRLICDPRGRIYMVNALYGLIDQEDGVQLFEPKSIFHADSAPNSTVHVGMTTSGGLPIADAVFSRCDPTVLYVTPVLVVPDAGCPYRAAAKLDLTDPNYTIAQLYGADPNIYSATQLTDCSAADTFLYHPHLQGMHEIELTHDGQWVCVLSCQASGDNDYVLIYDEATGTAAFDLTDPNDNRVVAGPTAMTLTFHDQVETLYLASSVPTDTDTATAQVWRYHVEEGNVSLAHKLSIDYPEPNRAVCSQTGSGLCAADGSLAMITSMTANPTDGAVYATGFTAPRISAGHCYEVGNQISCFDDTDPIFATPTFARIEAEQTQRVSGQMLSGYDPGATPALPLSILWTEVIAGDVTADGRVDLEDLAWLGQFWLMTVPPAPPCAKLTPELDNSTVDVNDLLVIIQNWLANSQGYSP